MPGGGAIEGYACAIEPVCVAGLLCGFLWVGRNACAAEAALPQAEEGLGCVGEMEHGRVAQSYTAEETLYALIRDWLGDKLAK